MSEDSTESDEAKRALDELYEDGRKPTLKELDEVIKKHGLKLVSIELPSGKKWEAESVQISQDEFEFYIKNRPLLAEVEKTLAVNSGEIKGALDTAQAASSLTLHSTTIKWMLEDDWLLNYLGSFKKTLARGNGSSARLSELNSLVKDTIQFIKASYPDRGSYHDMSNAETLKKRLETIGNAMGELRSLAEARLISSFEKNERLEGK